MQEKSTKYALDQAGVSPAHALDDRPNCESQRAQPMQYWSGESSHMKNVSYHDLRSYLEISPYKDRIKVKKACRDILHCFQIPDESDIDPIIYVIHKTSKPKQDS